MALTASERAQPDRADRSNLLLAGTLFVLYLVLNVATLHRYGITVDEPEHWFFGDRYLEFYLTLDPKVLDFSSAWWPPMQTWPVGPTLAALTANLFSERLGLLDSHDGHHLASVVLFGLALSGLFLFLAAHAGRTTAALSCLALAFQPRIWGEAHNNSEDVAHLVFYTLTVLTFLHGLLARRARWILGSALCWGLALGSKINAVSIPLVLAPSLIRLWSDAGERRASITRALLAYPFIALSVLFLAWPYFWISPPERLAYFWSYLVHWGYAGPANWQAAPILDVLITTPLPILILGLVGVAASLCGARPFGRPVSLTLALWFMLPIARSSLPGVLNYDVIRRFMEYAPALAIFAGIGGAALVERRGRAIRAAVTALLLLPGIEVWRYFPYETSYYNLLVGGLGGAQSRKVHQSADYWLSSYREGIDWINGHADPDSLLIVRHAPHFLPRYRLRQDLALNRHIRMDELSGRGRAVYFMYVPMEPYDYNMCLAEAFLRPAHELRRDGGVILRIYKLTADSGLRVTRNAFPPLREFSASSKGRWVTFRWEPPPARDIVGHILYYREADGQHEGTACFRGTGTRIEIFVGHRAGQYDLSLSVLTHRAEESEPTPEIRRELTD
jgi:hypothetical protein